MAKPSKNNNEGQRLHYHGARALYFGMISLASLNFFLKLSPKTNFI